MTSIADVELNRVYTVTSVSASVAGKLPSNAGTLTYAKSNNDAISKVTSWNVSNSGSVSATLSGGAVGDIITLPVTISSTNHMDSTVNVVITLTDKTNAGVTVTPDDAQTKTYGDASFPLEAAATNPGENGAWTWTSSNTDIAEVMTGAATTTVTIKAASSTPVTITASYDSDTTAGQATVTLTINPKSVEIPTAATGLQWTGNERTGVADGDGYTVVNGKKTAVGNYTATAALTSTTNYMWSDGTTADKEIAWSIAKADGPAAPDRPAGVAPTSENGSDGKITGVTTDMEYSADGTNYTACTGTEITGLTAGTYHVRTKETATREAGAAASVTVPAYAAPTYDVTITAGAGMTKTDASGAATHTGLSGPMTAVVYTANEGYYFPANYSVDAVTVSGIGVTRNSFTQITVSGTPTGNVEITLAGATAKTKPKAPTTPTASNCTTAANDDGIITGVTTEMEYRKSDATTWTDGAGADITGLAPGTYYVRASLQHRFRVPQQRGFLLRRPRLARCCAGVGRLYTNR